MLSKFCLSSYQQMPVLAAKVESTCDSCQLQLQCILQSHLPCIREYDVARHRARDVQITHFTGPMYEITQ